MQPLRMQALRVAARIVEDLAGGRPDAYASRFASSATIIAPECDYVPSTPDQFLALLGRPHGDRPLAVAGYESTHRQVALLGHVAVVTQRLILKTWSEGGAEPVHATSTIVLHKAGDWVVVHEHRSWPAG